MAETPPQQINRPWDGVTDVEILDQLCKERKIVLKHSVQDYHDRLDEWDLEQHNTNFITFGHSMPGDVEIIVRDGELANASIEVKREALDTWSKKVKAIYASRRQAKAEAYAQFRKSQDRRDEYVEELVDIFKAVLGLKKRSKGNVKRQKVKSGVDGGSHDMELKENTRNYHDPVRVFLDDVPSSMNYVKRVLARSVVDQGELSVNGNSVEVSTTSIPADVIEGPVIKKRKHDGSS